MNKNKRRKFWQLDLATDIWIKKNDALQGICQLSESGVARLQIMLKLGGKNQRFMVIISDFGQNSAKVGGSCPPPPAPCG